MRKDGTGNFPGPETRQLPANSGGTPPAAVRVCSTTEAYLKFGGVEVVATGDDVLVTPGASAFIATSGCSHFSVLFSHGAVNVIPLEG